jgi:hypothetical protein
MKNKIKHVLLLLTLVVFSCNGINKSTNGDQNNEQFECKKFYFPVEELVVPKVYHYVQDNPKDSQMFWVLSTKKENGKTNFFTKAYSLDSLGEFKLVETITEEVNETESRIVEYVEYHTGDSNKIVPIVATMTDNTVFKWVFFKNEKIVWNFYTKQVSPDGYRTNTTKQREYVNETTHVNFLGKRVKAIVFNDAFKIHAFHVKSNSKQLVKFYQKSLYAENIGMIKYARKFENGNEVKFLLSEILTMDEWNTRFK